MKRKRSGEYRYQRPSIARRRDRVLRRAALAFGRVLFREPFQPPFSPFLIPSGVDPAELEEAMLRPGRIIHVPVDA